MNSGPTKKIAGVIFDLDGTLYDLSGLKWRMALALWQSIKLLRTLSPVRNVLRTQTFSDGTELKQELFLQLADRASVSTDKAETWYKQDFYPNFVKILKRHKTARPGAADLLAELKDKGVKLAIVSDFGRVPARTQAIGLNPSLFDELLSSEDEGSLKPHFEPFVALARKWQLSPDQIVVLGDKEELDGTAADSCKMKFIGIAQNDKKTNNSQRILTWPQAVEHLRTNT